MRGTATTERRRTVDEEYLLLLLLMLRLEKLGAASRGLSMPEWQVSALVVLKRALLLAALTTMRDTLANIMKCIME
jgi:hypothetical protein